jgi:hypothetical protein
MLKKVLAEELNKALATGIAAAGSGRNGGEFLSLHPAAKASSSGASNWATTIHLPS